VLEAASLPHHFGLGCDVNHSKMMVLRLAQKAAPATGSEQFGVTQITRNTSAPGHDAGIEQGSRQNPEDTMYLEITCKAVLFTLIGLFAIAPVVMNNSAVALSSTESKVATRGAPASSVCNILYPVPCAYVQPW
jgi:hypothetical protein